MASKFKILVVERLRFSFLGSLPMQDTSRGKLAFRVFRVPSTKARIQTIPEMHDFQKKGFKNKASRLLSKVLPELFLHFESK